MNAQQSEQYNKFLDEVRSNIIDNMHRDTNLKYLINASYDRSLGIHKHTELDCLYAESMLLEDESDFYAAFGVNMENLFKAYSTFKNANSNVQAESMVIAAADSFLKYLVYTGTVLEMVNMLKDKNKITNLQYKFNQSVLEVTFEDANAEDTREFFINFQPVDWVCSPKNREREYTELQLNFNGDNQVDILNIKQAFKNLLRRPS